jgi:hypothetical protein
MQELIGKWFFIEAMGDTQLGKILSIDMRGNKFGYTTGNWKPLFPLNVALLMRFPSGDVRWHNFKHTVYEKDLEIITPEVAQLYMQANNLIIERNQNEQQLRRSI